MLLKKTANNFLVFARHPYNIYDIRAALFTVRFKTVGVELVGEISINNTTYRIQGIYGNNEEPIILLDKRHLARFAKIPKEVRQIIVHRPKETSVIEGWMKTDIEYLRRPWFVHSTEQAPTGILGLENPWNIPNSVQFLRSFSPSEIKTIHNIDEQRLGMPLAQRNNTGFSLTFDRTPYRLRLMKGFQTCSHLWANLVFSIHQHYPEYVISNMKPDMQYFPGIKNTMEEQCRIQSNYWEEYIL